MGKRYRSLWNKLCGDMRCTTAVLAFKSLPASLSLSVLSLYMCGRACICRWEGRGLIVFYEKIPLYILKYVFMYLLCVKQNDLTSREMCYTNKLDNQTF